ncbi:major vault protein-like isoform X1 [Branchiostoma floridae]|uniref:Major vault protein n=1 Tax=Branchiostoma floridae TaxID=7739 RepID=A0A9J7LWZ6_BRAFL|nr:major vault protein-like isoform X1 [Branchiostoma floridae]
MTERKQGRFSGGNSEESIFRIPPFYYMHVLDQNLNVTRTEVGPKTYIRQDNEKVVLPPEKMITVPPRHYCVVENPVVRGEDGAPVYDTSGQVKLVHADLEIRLAQDPFPLFPGETLKQNVTALKVVSADTALRLRAVLDLEDQTGQKRVAGDEWLFEGPGTYIPRKEVVVDETVRATVILPNQAIKLRARKETEDRDGNHRVTGEEWVVKKVGAYLPGAYEEVVDVVNAYVLTEKKALHMRALRTFKDFKNQTRKSGEEWLITMQDTETHIPDVYEEVVGVINITTLSNREYAVIVDPVGEDGKPQLGQRKLVKGEKSFFLQPGETLEDGIQPMYILEEDEGLILKANEAFKDMDANDDEEAEEVSSEPGAKKTLQKDGVERKPGDRWMIRGPKEYVPPVEVTVVMKRKAIPLDENEGIYIRNIKTGKVRAVCGQTYMLDQDEESWAKQLPPAVESLLTQNLVLDSGRPAFGSMMNICPDLGEIQQEVQVQKQQRSQPRFRPAEVGMAVQAYSNVGIDPLADRSDRGPRPRPDQPRDKTKVVTFRVPHNAAVQIYDYKEKKARVIFGPELVLLGPDEQFTQLSLSGGKPKRPNVIKSLCLLLGPDFCTDIITIETADHARLQLQMSYNWHFDVKDKTADGKKIFSVPDFVGDACKAVASRVRGAVAGVQFDDFHKNSARIIRASVFGLDENNKVRDVFKFPQNNLVITSVDIQSVEPVDQRTRDSLQKSVTLAIEITTNSQEAAARHEAERVEQEAKGRLERQKIHDEAEAENSRRDLLELQAKSAAVESTGQAKAEAQSRAEAARIEGEAAVEQAKLKAQASKIEAESELERLTTAREAELKYLREQNDMEVAKLREMADIETQKFKNQVDAIGAQTIQSIALAGPELQVKLLKGLGLTSTLITDGSSPINLFNTAGGLIGAMGGETRGPISRRRHSDSSDE